MVISPVKLEQNKQSSQAETVSMTDLHQDQSYYEAFKLKSTIPDKLFGTDGIRGEAGQFLNASLALSVGFWAGQVLREARSEEQPIILGKDSRNSSDMLASALSAGLTSAGLEVWNVGLCPTPCVSYLTQKTHAIAGIMISASHNPPEDNGIKFFSSRGTKLEAAITKTIEDAIRGQFPTHLHPVSLGKSFYRSELVYQYESFLKESLLPEFNFQGLRIVLDLAWGASAQIAPEVFRSMGAEVICLHEMPNGDRINVDCGSTHLNVLQAAVKEYQADLGFAFDGDADRVLATDAQGRVVDGDYILYLWGKQLKEARLLPNDHIIATVMANLGFERAWEQLGGQFTRTAVGDQYVQAEMFKTGAMLGGEQSGHILCHHHSFSGDGLQTALHLTALVHQSGVSLAELVDNSFTTYPQILRNVRVEDRQRRLQWQNCEKLQQAIAHAQTQLGEQGRILVRASGTEPVIRVMVEAVTSELTEYWTNTLVNAVEQYI